MKLALRTLLASVALLSPAALAKGDALSIDLQYGVRDAETLYGVATANGDLRFLNQGPSAAKVRWLDPLRGKEEARVLGPGQVLVTQGHLGVSVSEGTIVLVEKLGPGPIASGIASIPTAPQFWGCIPTDPCTFGSPQGESKSMHDSIHCIQSEGAFLPWHRGFYPSVNSMVGGTMCSIESYKGVLGVISKGGDMLLPKNDDSIGMPPEPELLPKNDDSIGIPPEPELLPKNDDFIGIPPEPEFGHGPGMHDSIHVWLPCPPYEPCDDVTVLSIWTAGSTTSIWTSGTASIWSDGTFSSIAPDGTVDL